jgi:hypothetical protein
LLVLLAPAVPQAVAHTASSLDYVAGAGEDGLRNYDFDSQTVSSSNVDWPIMALFWNNANVNQVKTNVNPRYGWATGSNEWGRISDSSPAASGSNCGSWCWDSDGGKKTDACTVTGTGGHIRIYAPPGSDRLYNISWGYYVPASLHQDHAECGTGTWYGYSETETWNLYQWYANTYGSSNANYYGLNGNNYEGYRAEGNHIWESDGWVSTFWTG